jgi:hypothetical protein
LAAAAAVTPTPSIRTSFYESTEVFRILYKRFLKKEGLTELDRLRLENKKEWQMSHLLGRYQQRTRKTIVGMYSRKLSMFQIFDIEATFLIFNDWE